MVVPRELMAWVSVKRLDAVSGGPSTATNGLAATCSNVMPAASTNNASKNSGYAGALAAGKNSRQPRPAVHSPMMMPVLYPTRLTMAPDGSDTTKYAVKNAYWINIALA